MARSGTAASAVSVDFATDDATALAGSDYTATSGTLKWAENDSSPKTITVPVSNATMFSGVRSFQVILTNPVGNGALIGSPGTSTVSISGGASADAGTIELSDNAYSASQTSVTRTITVNRTGGSSGAVSVAYSTADGTAVSGTDYTGTQGVLEWADGDATSKTFDVTISNAKAFAGSKTFSVSLSDVRSGATLGTPSSATVTITGSGATPAAGSLQLSVASYSVSQSAGSLKVTVTRANGSSGSVSVGYATANGTALAGTDYTSSKGTLTWADGDSASKTISIAVSNGTPFTGSRNFKVSLSSPSSTATVGNPGTATVTINGNGAPAAGNVELSKSSYAVAQGSGSVTITVNRTGGSGGAASVNYATSNGTAVAGTDFTATNGTLKWADGDAAAKSFSVAISGVSPFSGTRSFNVNLSNPSGATAGSPTSASVAITGSAAAATGSLQLSASSYTVAQSAGTLKVTVNRTGGSSGSISVSYATSNGSAMAGTDYTGASGTLNWADGDAASKTVSIAISNATPFTGSRTFNLTLSSPTAGASLSSPSSAAVTINGSGTSSSPSGGTFWVYHNGTFYWPGDYSWNATINYHDTVGKPGGVDIAVSIVAPWGGFQPFAFPSGGTPFDTTPYKYLTYCTKPTQAGQTHGTAIDADNDVADGVPIAIVAGPNTTKYGPVPQVGVWGCYKIPLADFGLTNPQILKFSITDGTGDTTNKFYVDEVAFTSQ